MSNRLRRGEMLQPLPPPHLQEVDELTALRAENEELKQWMSDTCEILHDIRPVLGGVDSHAVVGLLRRAENP